MQKVVFVMRGLWRFVVLVAALLAVACSRSNKAEGGQQASPSASVAPEVLASASAAPAQPPARRPDRPLNVLLITVEAMRADMPWLGYERKIAPRLTAIANDGVVYERYWSPAPFTAQAIPTILASRHASTLYRSGVFFAKYPDVNLFFPEVLQKAGIRTMALHAHKYFQTARFHQGFDVFEMVPGLVFDPNTDKQITSPKSTNGMIELLKDPKNTGGQFFAWVQYMDPHDQYLQHDEAPVFGKTARDRYDAEVWFTDMWIAKLLDWAKTQSWWKDTALIITGDHGEAFGEHDHYKHAFELWEETVRVPLVVSIPGVEAKRIPAKRTHLDLAPTILELMGQEVPEAFMGRSLVPEVYGAPAEDRDVLLELTPDSYNTPRRALIRADYKILVRELPKRVTLYNLAKDPGEKQDLSSSEPEKLEEMQAALDQTWKALPRIEPYGGNTLSTGRTARGPRGSAKAPAP
jgi:arylsulfatase A-like enzyme